MEIDFARAASAACFVLGVIMLMAWMLTRRF
jgi:hypothetical protein